MEEDIRLAKEVRLKSYSPYSNHQVGCVLKTKEGKVYTGTNIENGGIQVICAERVAFAKAISEGEKYFESILIVGEMKDKQPIKECLPCGYCRQFMSEFVDENFIIYTIDNGTVNKYLMKELLPKSFKL